MFETSICQSLFIEQVNFLHMTPNKYGFHSNQCVLFYFNETMKCVDGCFLLSRHNSVGDVDCMKGTLVLRKKENPKKFLEQIISRQSHYLSANAKRVLSRKIIFLMCLNQMKDFFRLQIIKLLASRKQSIFLNLSVALIRIRWSIWLSKKKCIYSYDSYTVCIVRSEYALQDGDVEVWVHMQIARSFAIVIFSEDIE